jgi:hypothetical protein
MPPVVLRGGTKQYEDEEHEQSREDVDDLHDSVEGEASRSVSESFGESVKELLFIFVTMRFHDGLLTEKVERNLPQKLYSFLL